MMSKGVKRTISYVKDQRVLQVLQKSLNIREQNVGLDVEERGDYHHGSCCSIVSQARQSGGHGFKSSLR